MKKQTIKILCVSLLAVALFSCSSTRIQWIPVYSIKGGGENDISSYDPEKALIINPQKNSVYAYFKADNKEGIVFANEYSIDFSRKVTLTTSSGTTTINSANSTKKKISYLNLYKSFYFTPPQSRADTLDLYYYNDDNMVIFNNAKFSDGMTLSYDIIGESVGTVPVSQVTLVDILPVGLRYQSSEYYISNSRGAVKHKVFTKEGKEALVFDLDLNQPLGPGKKFIIRVTVKVVKNKMEKIF
jgi:uncharacterized repeat protein (TIGR01451 family)